MPGSTGYSSDVPLYELIAKCRESAACRAARLEALAERVALLNADAAAALRKAETLIADSQRLLAEARRRVRGRGSL